VSTPDVSGAPDVLLRGCRYRWWVVPLASAVLLLGHLAHASDAPPVAVLGATAAALALNAALVAAARTQVRAALPHIAAILDVALVTLALAFTGSGAIVLFYLFPIGQLASGGAPRSVRWMAPLAALASLLGQFLHASWYGPVASATVVDLPAAVYLDAAALWIVSLVLFRGRAALSRRLLAARSAIAAVARGDLTLRLAGGADDLGLLEQSLNGLLQDLEAALVSARREADAVAAAAGSLSASTEELRRASAAAGGGASDLAARLQEQREVVASAEARGFAGAGDIGPLAEKARAVLASTEGARERILRAGSTLVSYGEEVRRTAEAVEALGPVSERIAELALSLGKLARQTKLLALNAAIEAARAEEHGQGFAVVAREVRTLADASARAARDVSGAIADVHDRVAEASDAIRSSEAKAREGGTVADAAEGAFREVFDGISALSTLVESATADSRRHSETAATVLEDLTRLGRLTAEIGPVATSAAAAATEQLAAIDRVLAAATQLAEATERLRGSIARFSTPPPGPASPDS